MIFDSKFDMAMVAYLDCLNQFANEVQRHGAFSLPYEMDKGKIRDTNSGQWHSIKLQFNSEENWTKALRYMLTNLKWGLAFVSMQYNKKDHDPSSNDSWLNIVTFFANLSNIQPIYFTLFHFRWTGCILCTRQ